MRSLAEEYPKASVAEALGVSRGRFYATPKPKDETALLEQVGSVAAEFVRYGERRLCAELKRRGTEVGRMKMRRLMRVLKISSKPAPRLTRTTNSNHDFERYPNLLKELLIDRPHQVWVADITYIWLRNEFVYLAVLMDVFTRQIVGWALSRRIDADLTLAALQKALGSYPAPQIHHSDQGTQYAAGRYTEALTERGITLSMAAVGCPEQNAYAERVIRTIKEEHVNLVEYGGFRDAERQIGRFIDDVYGHKRIHSSLGYLTPAEFAKQYEQERQATRTDV